MLKGVPSILSPDMLKVFMETGHGDEIVIADGHFPAASIVRRLFRSDGDNVPGLLAAILQFFPLDSYVDYPVAVMAVAPGDSYVPTIWEACREIVSKHDDTVCDFEFVERFAVKCPLKITRS